MKIRTRKIYSTVRKPEAVSPSGLFFWDLDRDRMYGDPSVAGFFGLDAEHVARGLSVQVYLARIYADDRAEVARAIHGAIVTGDPLYQSFRIAAIGGLARRIHVVGQSFGDHEDVNRFCTGIVFDPSQNHLASLPQLCADALSLAEKQGQDDAANHMREAIRAMRTRH